MFVRLFVYFGIVFFSLFFQIKWINDVIMSLFIEGCSSTSSLCAFNSTLYEWCGYDLQLLMILNQRTQLKNKQYNVWINNRVISYCKGQNLIIPTMHWLRKKLTKEEFHCFGRISPSVILTLVILSCSSLYALSYLLPSLFTTPFDIRVNNADQLNSKSYR